MFTKEQIVQEVQNNNVSFFENLHNGYAEDENGDEVSVDTSEVVEVYDQNWGDGNDWIVVLHFINLDLYVKMDGYYSSWDSSEFDSVVLAEPYEHTETRYREIK